MLDDALTYCNVNKGHNLQCLLWLSVFDGPTLFSVNLPVVDTIHSKGNKFVAVMKIKATCMSMEKKLVAN